MAPLIRSAVVVAIVASFANVAIGGCGARIASEEPNGSGAGAPCVSQSDASAIPAAADADAAPPTDAGVTVDATADAAGDANAPKICDPQDTRMCEVATAAEGASCPTTFEGAKATFTCATYPVGSYWVVGECGSYLYASIDGPGTLHAVDCIYDPSTHALIGSDGYECGAFCGGVNHVHWGVELMPCGFTGDTTQGSCDADAGADGG